MHNLHYEIINLKSRKHQSKSRNTVIQESFMNHGICFNFVILSDEFAILMGAGRVGKFMSSWVAWDISWITCIYIFIYIYVYIYTYICFTLIYLWSFMAYKVLCYLKLNFVLVPFWLVPMEYMFFDTLVYNLYK
jgi:hypothetical protein